MSDLNDIKPGDKITLFYFSSFNSLETVARVTKTQIILLTGIKYRKEDGCLVGSNSGCHLVKMTPIIEEQIKRKEFTMKFNSINWSKISFTKLEAIQAILDSRDGE